MKLKLKAGQNNTLLMLCIALIFWVAYIILATPAATGLQIGPRFDWPDETANYFWVSSLASGNGLSLAEPLNLIAGNQVHPRSFNVAADGRLVPGSFIGLILLYGLLAKIFGSWSIIYLTPTLAFAGAIAWYFLVRKLFGEAVGLLSGAFILFHPAWWYYSEFTLLPNIAFVSLLLISLAIIVAPKRLTPTAVILSGLLAGLVIAIRPSELIWLAAVYFAAGIYVKQNLKPYHFLIFFGSAFAVFAPVLFFQKIIFGSYLATGYDQFQSGAASCPVCGLMKNLILPFGFHPALMIKNFLKYFIGTCWWFSLPAMAGAVLMFFQAKRDKTAAGYLILCAVLFGWLTTYYGSWEFSDQQTLALNSLGASYIRYWLPLYLISLPLLAGLLVWLSGLVGKYWRLIAWLTVYGLFLLSANSVLWSAPDSVLPVKNRIAGYKAIAAEVNRLTESDAVIITVRKDKVFFPERKVIHSFEPLSENGQLQTYLKPLTEEVPVYYYALGPEENPSLNDGQMLVLVKNFGLEMLYKIQ